jgi:putative ABC transport system ATP-binding protein
LVDVPIIKTANLSKTYRRGKVEVSALNNVTLKVEKGDFVAIHGPSGSGKTTLLNLLGGLDTPTLGEVWIEGTDITKMNEGELSKIRCRKIGFIFQFYNLIPKMSALDNVELPLIFAKVPKNQRRTKATELLASVGLGQRLEHSSMELSAGEQQRVAVARALVNDPAIVLMDEPTGNLDEENTRKLMMLVQELNRSKKQTFVLTTHNLSLSEYANKAYFLHDGKLTIQKM